jgi:alanine racemase
LVENNITQTITSYDYALSLKTSKLLNCHIAVDTGMGRVGLRYDDENLIEKIEKIKENPNLNITHIFTHFAGADMETPYTDLQHQRIVDISNAVNIPFHCQNSAAAVNNYSGDYVRLGISMYGIKPDMNMKLPYELTPVMSFK